MPQTEKQKKHTNKKICTPNQILYIGKSKSSLRDGSPNVMICPNGLPPDRAGNAGGRRATATQVSVLFSAFLILVGDCGEISNTNRIFMNMKTWKHFVPKSTCWCKSYFLNGPLPSWPIRRYGAFSEVLSSRTKSFARCHPESRLDAMGLGSWFLW